MKLKVNLRGYEELYLLGCVLLPMSWFPNPASFLYQHLHLPAAPLILQPYLHFPPAYQE
jgi:hypothetical protein